MLQIGFVIGHIGNGEEGRLDRNPTDRVANANSASSGHTGHHAGERRRPAQEHRSHQRLAKPRLTGEDVSHLGDRETADENQHSGQNKQKA